jgi:hypothetical protein
MRILLPACVAVNPLRLAGCRSASKRMPWQWRAPGGDNFSGLHVSSQSRAQWFLHAGNLQSSAVSTEACSAPCAGAMHVLHSLSRTPWLGPRNPKRTTLQAGVAPHEALLLNSLRVLLSAAPVMEATIAGWCQAGRLERRRAASRPASHESEAPPAHLNLPTILPTNCFVSSQRPKPVSASHYIRARCKDAVLHCRCT